MDSLKENLAPADFERLRSLIKTECGINLNPEKKTMLEIRLRRRLRTLEMTTSSEYCRYVFSRQNHDEELVHLIDAVTTNKTDFFREPDHFDYLTSTALPALHARKGPYWKPLVWSAGCSTGEEPYTLAVVLSEFEQAQPGFRFSVLATDICTDVLSKARAGIYRADVVKPIPPHICRKYFMRSRDPGAGTFRVVPELRSKVEFRRLNFMDSDYRLPDAPEIIFCRNVIIYFDRATQTRLLENLIRHLAPGGYFFSGHSESLQHMSLPLVSVAPAVYRKGP